MTTPYYQDDSVTLYLGDCLEVDAWLAVDVLVTDPPYGIDWQPMLGRFQLKKQVQAPQITGDRTTDLRDAALNLWGNKPRIVFGSWRATRPNPVDHRLIWHKRGQPPGPCNAAFMSQDEEIYITGAGFRRSSPPLRSVITTDELRQGGGAASKIGHPTPKPVGLMEILIDRCPAGVVADPFAGSGSTLIAARNMGRKVIGVELEERYCEIAARRLSQMCLDFEAVRL